MKFNWVAEFKANSIEVFAWVSAMVGMAMFVVGLFWDYIAGVNVAHNEGLGIGQICWLAFWGLYTLYGWLLQNEWGEK